MLVGNEHPSRRADRAEEASVTGVPGEPAMGEALGSTAIITIDRFADSVPSAAAEA